ncbi:A disintegrin and metalloproteinase with thrombospondin motifs 16-like [Melitaea cinxia]|uniref:A disintegrin and metalloproteinase with thrombospondin motifs 16-like n=1 Tax=Melitaea cinxia TaxID=113334 RepID=UPI001E272991|nr:A disintegrin and metalloproteinase with thrombospondin motifs 16-like [Melitaea cinxia]
MQRTVYPYLEQGALYSYILSKVPCNNKLDSNKVPKCAFVCVTKVQYRVDLKVKTKPSIKYIAKPNHDITIKVMIHIDKVLTRKLVKEHRLTTRKTLKNITNGILEDARKLFKQSNLNQTVKFKLLDTRFLRNDKVISMNENAQKYLSSYCDWQSKKKISQRSLYYSVLLTGLDLYHMNNGRIIKSNSGRGYTRGMCSARKSCTLIEWDPKIIGFLLAHEIGHSLGMRHDGPPYNQCRDQKNIMAMRYDERHHPTSWSPCSRYYLKQFLTSSKSWCLKSESDRRTTMKYLN